jgi:hypothetical protein
MIDLTNFETPHKLHDVAGTIVGDPALVALDRHLDPRCAGDVDCACWACIRELAEERKSLEWKDEWFGVGLPPIEMGSD